MSRRWWKDFEKLHRTHRSLRPRVRASLAQPRLTRVDPIGDHAPPVSDALKRMECEPQHPTSRGQGYRTTAAGEQNVRQRSQLYVGKAWCFTRQGQTSQTLPPTPMAISGVLKMLYPQPTGTAVRGIIVPARTRLIGYQNPAFLFRGVSFPGLQALVCMWQE